MTFDTNVFNAFNENADKYYQRFKNDSQYHNWYQQLVDLMADDADVLDVGCGPGLLAEFILSQKPKSQMLGIDLSDNMIALAKKHVSQADFKTMNCLNVNELECYFDVICNAFVLPYLSPDDTKTLLTHCCDRLNPEGLLFLSWIVHPTLKQETSTSSDGRHHLDMYYHSLEMINTTLKQLGFKILFKAQQAEPLSQKTECCLIAQLSEQ
ncbi:class I SAM-dependent DNA methyltransferase [Marinicella rhabdoformis]|uniref:class I SAM-dependent DNA methyltransferase n=1 Tax=Marinicella rhabdoformis TaxID=2580566 RepID=UPI0012AEDF1D|nr:class I SAM-dependent methyltransferase [Marinicella rhabdoformis]